MSKQASNARQVLVTGIQTTGTPHLGNLAGAIQPAIEASRAPEVRAFFFLADYHALIGVWDAAALRRSTLEIAAAWLAFGLDPERVVFYRQSDIPEIFELTWMLSCLTAKGLMNRAHAYKAAVADNEAAGPQDDPDRGITMGLYNYPILMAADILMFKAGRVPVGRDQVQHLEMTRDIAARFNHHFGEKLVIPQASIREEAAVIAGLDGRKMSKSYGNTIPLFVSRKQLHKLVMKIKTDSTPPDEPKDPDGSSLFQLYRAFATPDQTRQLAADYRDGIGWGEVKKRLFELLDAQLAEPRERYVELTARPAEIETILRAGATKARAEAAPFLAELREAAGFTSLGNS
ncbi:MAG: tryptophan--tRNA ligase [Gammaproteobacteria bacterium]|nr:tryptophan--tRNA ligase [Gammaproteobacteria bacterium]